jgi:hypothetical protein
MHRAWHPITMHFIGIRNNDENTSSKMLKTEWIEKQGRILLGRGEVAMVEDVEVVLTLLQKWGVVH